MTGERGGCAHLPTHMSCRAEKCPWATLQIHFYLNAAPKAPHIEAAYCVAISSPEGAYRIAKGNISTFLDRNDMLYPRVGARRYLSHYCQAEQRPGMDGYSKQGADGICSLKVLCLLITLRPFRDFVLWLSFRSSGCRRCSWFCRPTDRWNDIRRRQLPSFRRAWLWSLS